MRPYGENECCQEQPKAARTTKMKMLQNRNCTLDADLDCDSELLLFSQSHSITAASFNLSSWGDGDSNADQKGLPFSTPRLDEDRCWDRQSNNHFNDDDDDDDTENDCASLDSSSTTATGSSCPQEDCEGNDNHGIERDCAPLDSSSTTTTTTGCICAKDDIINNSSRLNKVEEGDDAFVCWNTTMPHLHHDDNERNERLSRSVTFSPQVVSHVNYYEQSALEDVKNMYYTAHELQRMIDDFVAQGGTSCFLT